MIVIVGFQTLFVVNKLLRLPGFNLLGSLVGYKLRGYFLSMLTFVNIMFWCSRPGVAVFRDENLPP